MVAFLGVVRAWWLRAFSLLLLAVGIFGARSAAAIEPGYITQLPTPPAMRAKVQGKNPLETAARQFGAFSILREVVSDLSEGRILRGTAGAAETQAWIGFGDAANEATRQGIAILTQSGAPKTGFDSPSPTWTRLSNQYRFDPGLRTEVYDAFLSPTLIAAENAEQQRQQQELGQSRRTVSSSDADGSSASGSPSSSPWINMGGPGFLALLNTIGGTSLVGIGILFLLGAGALYPLAAIYRSRRVSMWPVTGTVTSTKKWSESHTHTTPGTYNPQTGYTTPGSSQTTTHHYDQFFIHDGNRENTVTLRGSTFAVNAGQRVTAVWAGSKQNARQWYVCRVYNHSTGVGQNVYNGLRWARGRSAGVGMLISLLFFVVAALAFSLTGNIPNNKSADVLVPIIAVAIEFWVCGSIAIRVVHLFLDRRLYARARACENPGSV